MATNILASRLAHLEHQGILVKRLFHYADIHTANGNFC